MNIRIGTYEKLVKFLIVPGLSNKIIFGNNWLLDDKWILDFKNRKIIMDCYDVPCKLMLYGRPSAKRVLSISNGDYTFIPILLGSRLEAEISVFAISSKDTRQVVSHLTCSKSIGIQTDEINNCLSVTDMNNSVIEIDNKMLCNNMNLNSIKCNFQITNHGVKSQIEKSECNSIVVGTHDNSRNMSENMNSNNNVDLCDSCNNEFNILSILFENNDCAHYQT